MTDAGWPGYSEGSGGLWAWGRRCWVSALLAGLGIEPPLLWVSCTLTYMHACLSCSPQGMAFTLEERLQLGIHGLIPPCFLSQDVQLLRVMRYYERQQSDLDKWVLDACPLTRAPGSAVSCGPHMVFWTLARKGQEPRESPDPALPSTGWWSPWWPGLVMIEPRSVCPGGLRRLPELRQWDLVGPSGSDEIRVSPGSISSTNGSTNGPQHSAAEFTEGFHAVGRRGAEM